jgi:hypothetical protein
MAKTKPKIKSESKQRWVAILGILLAGLLIGLGILAYRLTRTVDFSWEQANSVEAKEAVRKMTLLRNGIESGKKGFVRLSQLEINSYLLGTLTNATPDPGVKLTNVKIDLTKSNFTLVSFGEIKVLNWAVPIAMKRNFRTEQGTNSWEFPLDEVHVGDVKIPRRVWPYLSSVARRLDQPLGAQFAWATNIPAMRLARNEMSGDAELRVYTFVPGLLD